MGHEVEELSAEELGRNEPVELGKPNKKLGLEGKPNNRPKDLFADLPAGKEYPYGPKKGQGYPDQRSLKGQEGKNLLYVPPKPITIAGGKAEDPAFPGVIKGHMTAQDIRGMTKPVADALETAKSAKAGEEKMEAYQLKEYTRKLKAVAAAVSAPLKGVGLLSGELLQQLGIQRGNFFHCKSALMKCKATKAKSTDLDLGESDDFISTKTAKQEDRAVRGVSAVDDKEKAKTKKDPAKQVKNSALQRYIKKQKKSPYHMLDDQAGKKLPEDKMDASHLKNMMGPLAASIAIAKKEDAKEAANDEEQVKEANAKSFSAEKEGDQVKAALLDNDKPQTTASVVASIGDTTKKLEQCLSDLGSKCPEQRKKLRVATPAVPLNAAKPQ